MIPVPLPLRRSLPLRWWWPLVRNRSQAVISPEDVEAFRQNGYVVLRNFVSSVEVERIATLCARLFERRAGWGRGDFFDMVAPEAAGVPYAMPQLVNAAAYEPRLAATRFWADAQVIARTLLSPAASVHIDHAIVKPPRTGPETPWHQDQAFHAAGSRTENITFWLPLQDVDEANGCLSFLPGSHLGPVVPHRRHQGDQRVHCIEAVDVDPERMVKVPLRAGDVSVHHSRTLHQAGPNFSGQPRRSYAVLFAVDVGRVLVTETYPWNASNLSAREGRRRAAARSPLAAAAGLGRRLFRSPPDVPHRAPTGREDEPPTKTAAP